MTSKSSFPTPWAQGPSSTCRERLQGLRGIVQPITCSIDAGGSLRTGVLDRLCHAQRIITAKHHCQCEVWPTVGQTRCQARFADPAQAVDEEPGVATLAQHLRLVCSSVAAPQTPPAGCRRLLPALVQKLLVAVICNQAPTAPAYQRPATGPAQPQPRDASHASAAARGIEQRPARSTASSSRPRRDRFSYSALANAVASWS